MLTLFGNGDLDLFHEKESHDVESASLDFEKILFEDLSFVLEKAFFKGIYLLALVSDSGSVVFLH